MLINDEKKPAKLQINVVVLVMTSCEEVSLTGSVGKQAASSRTLKHAHSHAARIVEQVRHCSVTLM
jgi:hypothetical protein